jgi:hypothetical protein
MLVLIICGCETISSSQEEIALTREETYARQFERGFLYIEDKVSHCNTDINIQDAGVLEVISDTSEIEKKILGHAK